MSFTNKSNILTDFTGEHMTSLGEIVNKYGAEHALLVLICRVFLGSADNNEVDSFVNEHKIDWDYFYHVVKRNRVRPVSYQVLSKAEVPENLLRKLQNDNKNISVRGIEHLKELLDISSALEQYDIEVLPYKGLVLSAAYSANFHLREFSDIDFLVLLKNNGDINRLRDFFKQRGYTPMADIPDKFISTFTKHACEYYFEKHKNGERKFHIDVHWLAHHPSFDLVETISNETLFQNPTSINISGKKIKTLNDNNHLITLILHHGIREDWASLKYLLDIALVIKNGDIDWSYQKKMSKTNQYNKVLDTGLALIDELFGIHTNTKQNINTSYYFDLILSGKPRKKSFFRKQLRKILLTDQLKGKLKLLSKSVSYSFYPSRLDYDFVKLPKSLFSLYFFVKIIRYSFTRKHGID